MPSFQMTVQRWMIVVLAAAVLAAMARFDSPCTPFAPFLAGLYLCGILGIPLAQWRGRRWQTGFWLGLLLGPIGLILTASNPVSIDKSFSPDVDADRSPPESPGTG